MRPDHVVQISIDTGHPGLWPWGEPQQIRDACDEQAGQPDGGGHPR